MYIFTYAFVPKISMEVVECKWWLATCQCDQMTKYYLFNIWPLTTMKICSIVYKLCHNRSKLTQLLNKWPKTWILAKVSKFCQIWSHFNLPTNVVWQDFHSIVNIVFPFEHDSSSEEIFWREQKWFLLSDRSIYRL